MVPNISHETLAGADPNSSFPCCFPRLAKILTGVGFTWDSATGFVDAICHPPRKFPALQCSRFFSSGSSRISAIDAIYQSHYFVERGDVKLSH